VLRIASIAFAAAALAGAASAQTPAPAAAPAHDHAAMMAAQAKPAAAAGKLSTASTVRELMGNPAAKAVLEKHTPAIVASPELELAMDMKFADLQAFPQAQLTPELVAAIDADLGKL
jgi:para-nitrobenzyl esterase